MPSRNGPVLVLFPDDWAAFSPTLLRLVDAIAEQAEVVACVVATDRFPSSALVEPRYRRVHMPTWSKRTGLYGLARWGWLASAAVPLRRDASSVVAFDFHGALAARALGRRFHFVSLELAFLPLTRRVVERHASSVMIQSRARLDVLSGDRHWSGIPTFFVQNAPSFTAAPVRATDPDPRNPRLVYLGSSTPLHGLNAMLELLRHWSTASLTLRGPVPPASMQLLERRAADLLASRRLVVDPTYLDESAIARYLAGFDLGLCLYQAPAGASLDINYRTSPSGKMFNYFAAGLPVLASGEPGLLPVTEFCAGLQVEDLSPATLRTAGLAIIGAHDRFRKGAISAAAHFDFGRSVRPFVDAVLAGSD